MGELKSFVNKGINIEETFKDYEVLFVIDNNEEEVLVVYKSNYGRIS